jgi:hypothetical protein
MRPKDHQFTGFSFGGQTFIFNVLPFGMATSVSSFTRVMETILGHDILKFTIVYIDNCLVASTDFETHLLHLDMLLTKFKEANTTLNMKENIWRAKELSF